MKNAAKYPVLMLVDDNRIDNFINQKMLEQYYSVDKFYIFNKSLDALDCLKKLDEKKEMDHLIPSFLFLDLEMPVMNGFEFMQRFEKLSHKIKDKCKVIILSNSSNPVDMEKAFNNNYIVGFLTKPLVKSNLTTLDLMLNRTNS